MTKSHTPPPAVAASNIFKSFDGSPVLRGCTLRVERGHIHALLGQNGAGKSTLVKILNGVHPAGSFDGAISVAGVRVRFSSPAHARGSGIGYVPQEIELLEHLSVAENLFVGQLGADSRIRVDWNKIRERAETLLKELGLFFCPSAQVAILTAAERHLLMIARALAAHPALLILDEPTTSLSEPEIERLFLILQRLRERGGTMIYITHRLPEVLALCDRASVLRDGVLAGEFDRSDFSVETLVSAMTGSAVNYAVSAARRTRSGTTVVLKAEHISVVSAGKRRVHDVNFELSAGEILGVAGVVGSGRTELLRALYGDLRYSGSLSIESQRCDITSVRKARKAGIALLTEDRKRDGLLFNLAARPNVTIGHLKPFSLAGIVDSGKERNCVIQQLAAFSVRVPTTEAAVSHLSGGNQQKLLLARVLLCTPKILLLDEPTKGVDISTRQEIYQLIRKLARRGVGVIVVSSDLEEVLTLADRCVVMAEGSLVEEFAGGEGTEYKVLHAIARARSSSVIGSVGEGRLANERNDSQRESNSGHGWRYRDRQGGCCAACGCGRLCSRCGFGRS